MSDRNDVPAARTRRPVLDGHAPADPFALLRDWAPANDDPDRPCATLATVDEAGLPDARTVLLSSVTRDTVTFHSATDSRKSAQLLAHPRAALVVRWDAEARQVVLRGPVSQSSARERRIAFARRSRYLQVLAWLNTPELAGLDRPERERRWAAFDQGHPDLEPPPNWVGYALRPADILFWEGSADGPSRRVRYRRPAGVWEMEALAG
ncbi:pyridoxine/pyridoxamine 5'-phosphate oxidase [Myceligenerans indicum]|uniref:Pyridoxine 5'-phosphate oxidase n=1 Tax=Myceligenerans indicum TaxID=2593663 RepID=A0ABS1LP15_9MICO|nr:pyridoxamine 5'-phosphate oxidase family protein [Myceligenerans indicum]MBL0887969.1 pyridoxine 5'-phosphate oxidase [Myceligenerans indicum]